MGSLTDDGDSYTFVWDAFGRLRKIHNRANSNLIAEYRYNGLGYRISIHEDTDTDGDVDSNDKWFHHAFDERWRWVATFRENDTDPKEEFLHHAAGFNGHGTASYIDLVALRDRDANTAWTSASDGTLEERLYYCQNWRADVVALSRLPACRSSRCGTRRMACRSGCRRGTAIRMGIAMQTTKHDLAHGLRHPKHTTFEVTWIWMAISTQMTGRGLARVPEPISEEAIYRLLQLLVACAPAAAQ